LVRLAVAAPLSVVLLGNSRQGREHAMWLLIIYVGLVIIGDIADYLIGLFIEYMWGDQASLLSFLFLYFLFLWLAWVAAVKITEPDTETQTA
jgi:hypothetical protein